MRLKQHQVPPKHCFQIGLGCVIGKSEGNGQKSLRSTRVRGQGLVRMGLGFYTLNSRRPLTYETKKQTRHTKLDIRN